MDKILTVNDVANILQVKAITVREMFREKRLRGFKVGKAWRTTETMLQEDIDALARGESPTELPSPIPLGSGQSKGASPAKKPAGPPKPEASGDVEKAQPPAAAPDGGDKTEGRGRKKSPEKSAPVVPGEDDTQQMLF